MNKAITWIEGLKKYGKIEIRPRGNSMTPIIYSGNLVTITSDISDIKKNDIVFCKVNGNYCVHLVTAINGSSFQISNNHGHINGWTSRIYGKVIKIEK